jgi:hypothetical protein
MNDEIMLVFVETSLSAVKDAWEYRKTDRGKCCCADSKVV